MADLYHQFGGDLVFSATWDILTVSQGNGETTQRLLRRLLTPAKGYIWELTFGAGLPALVGTTTPAIAIQNAIRAQVFNEPTVAKVPEPTITVSSSPDGMYSATIAYTDAVSGAAQILTVPVN